MAILPPRQTANDHSFGTIGTNELTGNVMAKNSSNSTLSELILLSDPKDGVRARASSILQKNVKLYGPMNALDISNDSTCWNSEGSSSAATQKKKTSCWYQLDFGRPVVPQTIRLQCQAGFVGETCLVDGLLVGNNSDWQRLDELEVEDVHKEQVHDLSSSAQPCTSLRLVFDDFTDFYGRVTIYSIQIWGRLSQESTEDGEASSKS